MTDTVAAEAIFANLNDDEFNPLRFATVADCGFPGWCTTIQDMIDGDAPVLRPLAVVKDAKYHKDGTTKLERQSAWLTTIRQANEWVNGTIKKAFPRITTSCSINDMQSYVLDIKLVIHLSNYRNRTMQWGQTRSVFMPHITAHFESQGLEYDEKTGRVHDPNAPDAPLEEVEQVCGLLPALDGFDEDQQEYEDLESDDD
jgi:hypothetical protein